MDSKVSMTSSKKCMSPELYRSKKSILKKADSGGSQDREDLEKLLPADSQSDDGYRPFRDYSSISGGGHQRHETNASSGQSIAWRCPNPYCSKNAPAVPSSALPICICGAVMVSVEAPDRQ